MTNLAITPNGSCQAPSRTGARGHELPVAHRLRATAPHLRAAIRWRRGSISTDDAGLDTAGLPLHCYQRTLMPREPCTEDLTSASPPMFHRVPISPYRLTVGVSARVAPAATSPAL